MYYKNCVNCALTSVAMKLNGIVPDNKIEYFLPQPPNHFRLRLGAGVI